MRHHGVIGCRSGYMDIGLNQYDMVRRQVELYFREYVADTCGKYRRIADEKGTVCPQTAGVPHQLPLVKPKPELLVGQLQHEGGIGRPATKACADGNRFMQMDMDRRKIVCLLKQPVGAYAQVIRTVIRNGKPRREQLRFLSHYHLECVVQTNGIKDGFQVMVPVGPSA